MRYRKLMLPIAVAVIIALSTITAANAVILSIEGASTEPGASVTLTVSVDQPQEIAAAAFTLTYDTDYLILDNIESTFFDNFVNQWVSLSPLPDPFPPSTATLDGKVYTQPLLYKVSTGKMLVAAARVKEGLTATTLFTLHFTVASNTPGGVYPISISQIIVNSIAGGYPAEGETIPILTAHVTGESDLSLAFPALNTSVVNNSITVTTSIPDTDGDNIDDNWELLYFGNLTTATAISDYEQDGYSDLQEYLNQLNGEFDPQGGPYDPTVINAPGGTGYINPDNVNNKSFWLLIMPVILNSTPTQ